jgi:chemotaxis protein MotA
MSVFPLTLLVAGSIFSLAMMILKQSFMNYYDLIGFTIVVGGSFAVGLSVLPWKNKKDLVTIFKNVFFKNTASFNNLATDCLNVIKGAGVPQGVELYKIVLKEGLQLHMLEIDKSMAARILKEKVMSTLNRKKKIANAIKSWSSYPPAFGLIGTVIGLVNVMRGIGSGAQTSETAISMSIALVSTMYGLLVSNLILRPASEYIQKQISEEENAAEVALMTIKMVYEQTSPIDARELLNACVVDEEHIAIDEVA